jgi:hypothetical protein
MGRTGRGGCVEEGAVKVLGVYAGPALTFSWPGSEQKWRPTAVISIQQTDLSADYAVADGDPAPASRESR